MSTRTRLILASASPRRRDILGALGLRFRVVPSGVPEPEPARGVSPARHALELARLKARAVADRAGTGWVIGADTLVAVNRRLLGKPSDDRDAADMLQSLSGRWHEVVTGLCLIDAATGASAARAESTRVHMRRLSAREIDWYVGTGEPRDKAGAYAVQGRAALFVDRIEGCYFNVVGFPVAAFERLCRRMRVELSSLLAD